VTQSHTQKPTKAKTADSAITGRVQRVENTTDATRGKPLVDRVELRCNEMRADLDKLAADALREREDLELALSAAEGMLTGDRDNLSDVIADDMNRWLERNKHLAETTPVMHASKKKTSA
jgi:hypothetical protein